MPKLRPFRALSLLLAALGTIARESSHEGTCLHDASKPICRVPTHIGDARVEDREMSSQDTGSAFNMYIWFNLATSASHPQLEQSARGYVFTNGNHQGSCDGAGDCSIAVSDLVAGFYEVRILVVDSNWIASAVHAFESSEGQRGRVGLLAMDSYKVNFFHVTLLSTVVDPFSPMLEQPHVNPAARPAALVTENRYEVNDEGDTLSELLLTHGGRQVSFVSPLVPRDNEAHNVRASTWECRFQALDGAATAGIVETDGAHTFRVSCPVPDALIPVALTDGRVAVEVWRDGVDIAPDEEYRTAELPPERPDGGGGGGRGAAVEICTMVRNEEAFVVEWVEFHLLLGARHLTLYLHLTVDGAAQRLAPYVQRGLVTLRAWDFNWSPMYMRFQSHAWNDCALRAAARGEEVWVSILDVDEFLVPGTGEYGAGARGGGVAGALEALAAQGEVDQVRPSAIKLAWLPFSSRAEEGAELTVERFRWHGGQFVPEVGRMVGDQQHGKVVFRADHGVHLDFAGHKATIARGGVVEASPTQLHIAHYIGRPRSYTLPDQRHEAEAKRRRRAAEEEGMVRWRRNPLCGLAASLREQVCGRRAEEFAGAAELCDRAGAREQGAGGEGGREAAVRECEDGERGRFDAGEEGAG